MSLEINKKASLWTLWRYGFWRCLFYINHQCVLALDFLEHQPYSLINTTHPSKALHISQLFFENQIYLPSQPFPHNLQSKTMAGELVFITGGTGYIGFRTLVAALKAGYNVRAQVRSEAKAQFILATPSIKALNPGSKLTFIVIPNLQTPDAYDEALKGVDYVLHLASPLPAEHEDYETHMIRPAVDATLAVLKAALKFPNIKRIVITSSGVAIMSWNEFAVVETDKVFVATDRTPTPTGPYSNGFEAYCASKVAALNSTDDFVAKEKPSFDIVNILPGFVLGKNELVNKPEDILTGTNSFGFAGAFGIDNPQPTAGVTVHVNDVASAHVLALDKKKVPDHYTSLLAVADSEGYTIWGDNVEIVKKSYPEAVKEGIFKPTGSTPTKKALTDASITERLLGIKFLNYEAQVKSIAEHYLQLVKQVGGIGNVGEVLSRF
jgi:nucleoside-diphosphate-sugar epimerase